jgi:hypothetical protein
VGLTVVDSQRTPYGSGGGGVKDPTHFKIYGVEPGKYVVRVGSPPLDNYVQSVRSGNRDLLHEQLEVPEDGKVLPIEVVVRDDFGFIKVRGSEGVRQSSIVYVREDVSLSTPQFPRMNEKNLSFAVAPGSYAVYAFEPSDRQISDPEFLSDYAERAVHVTVSAKETKTINVDVIHFEH